MTRSSSTSYKGSLQQQRKEEVEACRQARAAEKATEKLLSNGNLSLLLLLLLSLSIGLRSQEERAGERDWKLRRLVVIVETQLFLLRRTAVVAPKTQVSVPLKEDTILDKDGFQQLAQKSFGVIAEVVLKRLIIQSLGPGTMFVI